MFRPVLFLSLILLGLMSSSCQPFSTTAWLDALNRPGPSSRIYIALVGDMMLGTNFPENTLADDDGVSLLQSVAPFLRDADITFGNLEGVLLDEGEPAKSCDVPEHCYLFRSPSHYAHYLREAGFDVMSLANNHARDFGESGLSASMTTLASLGIRHSGPHGDVASWRVKGRRVALIAFAPFIGSYNMLDENRARELVEELSQTHDIVIVSVHAGAEGPEAMHVTFADERYHGEDRGNVDQFARAVIDAGADLVVGHGPHVPRALQVYRGRMIAYSLGNFCTFWGISVDQARGLAPILRLELDGDGRFLQGQITSALQIRPYGPVPDPEHRAAKLMAELTRADFPDSSLLISDEGQVRLKSSRLTKAAQPSMDSGFRPMF
ncbi:MAG TPA: CapA family protein [Gammaproteobacteria bacterium]|nr:CapA family protein [Gammaproteobacteria bacterium]